MTLASTRACSTPKLSAPVPSDNIKASGLTCSARTLLYLPRYVVCADFTIVAVLTWQQLLVTLGVILQCCGPNHPETRTMAGVLLDFLWTLRFHPEAAVRRAVLFALSRVLVSIHPFILAEEFAGLVEEIIAWLASLKRSDPDVTSRQLASLCLSALSETLDTYQHYLQSSQTEGGFQLPRAGGRLDLTASASLASALTDTVVPVEHTPSATLPQSQPSQPQAQEDSDSSDQSNGFGMTLRAVRRL